MYQKGELDAAVAMQLLGGMGSAPNAAKGEGDDKGNENTKKRPLDAVSTTPSEPNGSTGGGGGSLDEVLEQAKRAKMESCFSIQIHFDFDLYDT